MASTSPDPAARERAVEFSILDALGRNGVQRVHVHDYMAPGAPSVVAQKGASIACRAERALVMARRGDQVIVATEVDSGFLDYLDELGIGPGREAVLVLDRLLATVRGDSDLQIATQGSLAALASDPHFAARLAERLAPRLSPDRPTVLTPYYANGSLQSLRQALSGSLASPVTIEGGAVHAVRLANRKDLMRNEALRLGVPVAPGEVMSCEEPGEAFWTDIVDGCDALLRDFGGAIVRGAWSMTGADVLIRRSAQHRSAVRAWLRQRRHVDCYLLEALLTVVASPNVQVWIDAAGPLLLGSSEQRLNVDRTHVGNVYPCTASLLPQMETAALTMCRMLHARGLRGPLGVDMMQIEANGSELPGLAFAEINGRMNASSYSFALFEGVNVRRQEALRPPAGAWISRHDTPVMASHFNALREQLGDLLYAHQRLRGVIPYNTGLLQVGLVDLLLLAPSTEEALELEREVLDRLV